MNFFIKIYVFLKINLFQDLHIYFKVLHNDASGIKKLVARRGFAAPFGVSTLLFEWVAIFVVIDSA